MLTAYLTRSLRHSKGNFGKWMLGVPLIAVAAGVIVSAGYPDRVRTMTPLIPEISSSSETVPTHRFARTQRAPSFKIGGPAAAGIAVLMNDSPELRARAEQARIKHASERLSDDAGLPL